MYLKQKNFYVVFIVLFFGVLVIFSANVLAVPSLGVTTNGIYYTASGNSFEPYQDYFASGSAPASDNDGNHGFAIGPSGSTLTIFTNILNADIYLMTDTDTWNTSGNPQFGEQEFTQIPYETGQADGYKPRPYFALNLGHVNTSTWTLLPTNPFSGGNFYSYTAAIEYSGTIPIGSYFFASADIGNNGLNFNSSRGSSTDPFSPKTTSAVGNEGSVPSSGSVPEPATVLLLGSGIIGLAGLMRKKQGWFLKK